MTETRIVTVVDDMGREVTIHGCPERIVSLAPSNTELLFALGLGNRTVGVTDQSDYPEEALQIPSVGGYTTISIERVVARRPDLVLAARGNTLDVLERLESFDFPVLVIDPETIDDILDDIHLIGRATGTECLAEELSDDLASRIDAVTERVADRNETPTVAHVVWHDPIWVSGNHTFQDEVIRMAGGRNAFPDIDGWQIVSLEEFVSADPDYILVSSGTGMGEAGCDAVYNYIFTEPRLARLDAVENHRVVLIDADTISRAGPRIVDALEEVAAAVNPDLFNWSAGTYSPAEQSPHSTMVSLLAIVCIALFFAWKRK
ncbi:MAG: ABC transporter substrate-binding protein [Methanomicrobiales archaeon]